MNRFPKIFFAFLFLSAIPLISHAQITQIVFTTDPQTIEPGEISDTITIQLQDSDGNSQQTSETIDVEFLSTSTSTSEFLSPNSDNPVTTTMASSTANKNFRYRDSAEGEFTLTVNATGRDSGEVWSASQTIVVDTPVPTLPVIEISGTISADTTWSPGEGTYILENTVTVAASTTLTILPGTVIKGKNGGAGILAINGTLVAEGTDSEVIYFTSLLDDEVGGDSDTNGSTTGSPGDWQGIYFNPGSSGSLEYVEVRYAGYGPGFPSYGHFVGIENDGGLLEIKHSNIHDNYRIISNGGGGIMASGIGIYNRNGTLTVSDTIIGNNVYGVNIVSGTTTISNSVFQNNTDNTGYSTGYGIYANGQGSLALLNNIFSGNGKTAFVEAQIDFSHTGNTSSDAVNRGFEMSGYARDGAVWHTSDLPIINTGGLFVEEGEVLTISPGTVLKMSPGTFVQVEGTLTAQGTKSQPIYFTSLKDDAVALDTNGDGAASLPNMTDWNGLTFQAGSVGNVSHTIIRYSGRFTSSGRAAVFNLGGDLLLDNITFSNNYQYDIYQNTGSSTISHTLFSTGISYAIFNASTTALDARNNWWGTDEGPTIPSNFTGTNPRITENVLYDPWIRRDPSLPNPVIIVPGIISSRLNIGNLEVWPDMLQMAFSVDDFYLNGLLLNQNGENVGSVYPTSIIKSIGDFDFFTGLFSNLNSEGYINAVDLFEYPYDWRVDIQVSSLELKEEIDEIKLQTGAEKVDLIAHSMGGLLVKKYLKDYGGDSVDKFIDIGTPHTGSPKSFKALNYGDNFGFEKYGFDILNPIRTKEISQNMPAVYQLLPSGDYFDSETPYYVTDLTDGLNRFNFSQTKDYLKTEGRNSLLIDRADEFHQEIDNLNPADYGVETYNIVGCGTPTIGHFYILEDGEHPIYNIRYINGDGTVPLKSAEAIPALETYYVKNAQHAVMPSTSGVKELVASILTEEDFTIASYSNLATNSNDCQIPNGKLVSFHSPIELHVYDPSGNHAGPDENGDIENEIAGVVYEVIDDNKFAFLPDGVLYNIQGSATDVGTFDTRIQEIVNGEVSTTTIFTDMSLTINTQVNFDIGSSIPNQIYLDHDGDEVFESSQSMSTTTAGILESTGKVAEVPVEPAIISSSGSSRVQSINIEEIATSSEIVKFSEVMEESVLGASVVQSNPMKIIEEISIATSQPEGQKYENTAVVYKSLGQKMWGIFKSVWSWIKSKL